MDTTEIVYVAVLTPHIPDRNLLYCAISCQLQSSYEQGDVVSLRMDGIYKGKKGGYFPNAMIMDIWFNGDSRHTKIFSTGKVQIPGMSTEQEFLDLIEIVCGLLNKAELFLSELNGVDCSSLLSKLEGEEFIMVSTFSLKNDSVLGSLTFCEYTTQLGIYREKIEIENEMESRLLETCTDVLLDSNSPHYILEERLNLLTSVSREKRTYSLDHFKLCSIVMKYRLNYPINRYVLVAELTKRGYTTYFANTSTQSEVSVYAAAFPDDKMNFLPKGSIRHSGKNLGDMLVNKKIILGHIASVEHLIKMKK